jgi:hypothetical protein
LCVKNLVACSAGPLGAVTLSEAEAVSRVAAAAIIAQDILWLYARCRVPAPIPCSIGEDASEAPVVADRDRSDWRKRVARHCTRETKNNDVVYRALC